MKKSDFENVIFVEKCDFENVIFVGKSDFENAIFVTNVILKMLMKLMI